MTNEQTVRENDYNTGKKGEDKLYDRLRQKGYIVEEKPRWCWHDFKLNDTYLGEHKKRPNIYKDSYPTTIFPYSKWKEWKKVCKQYNDCIFIFTFKDGSFYTSYTHMKSLMKQGRTFEIEKKFQRHSGFTHKPRPHIHIPVDILQPLDTLKVA